MHALRAAPLTVLALVLTACSSPVPGSGPPGSAVAPTVPPTGARTVVELRDPDHPEIGALVTEVVEGDGGTAASLRAVTSGEARLVLEEVVLPDERYVHVAAVEGVLWDRAAWIRFDTTDPRHVAHLEANPTGLVEAAGLFDARAGDPYGEDEIVAVDRVGEGLRIVRTAAGLELTVRREVLRPAPAIGPPGSLPVVPFDDIEQLVEAG